jgi:hypothetical protein
MLVINREQVNASRAARRDRHHEAAPRQLSRGKVDAEHACQMTFGRHANISKAYF